MKPVLVTTVKLLQVLGIGIVFVSVALVMGDKAMSHKHKLEDKRSGLARENQSLTQEIRVLERKVTLLRTDTRMIEKVAKCKLGMARPDETVYMFNEKRRGARGPGQ